MGYVTAAYGIYSAIKGAQDAKSTGDSNKALNEQSAQDALDRGAQQEILYRRNLAKMIGGQRNEIGARNVEASGTALKLLEDTAQIGQEDIINIRNNAAREAWGYKVAGKNAYTQARNQQAQYYGSALTSAAQAYGQWYDRNA